MKNIDVDELYCYSLDKSIEFLKDNTHYLDSIKIDDIIEIHYAFNKDTYVLLKDNSLYKNGNKISDNIKTLGFSCGVFMYAFTNDKEVIYLLNNDEATLFINNNGESYKKVIIDSIKIVGLTNDNKIKFIGTLVDQVIDYERFFDVDDIGYVEDDIVVIKNDKVLGLFNNEEYDFDDIVLLDSNNEYIII